MSDRRRSPDLSTRRPAHRPGLEVQRRPLRPAEATRMMSDIRRAPNITGYSRREWSGKRDTYVLVQVDSGELLGAILVHHLAGRWSELAVVYVREEFRGKGLGRIMLDAVLSTLRQHRRRALLLYSNEAMERLARDHGFRIFANEDDFVRGSTARWMFLKVAYQAQWLCSLYRIRELRRKARELGSTFTFKVAVLPAAAPAPAPARTGP